MDRILEENIKLKQQVKSLENIEDKLEDSLEQAENIIDTIRECLLILTKDLKVIKANRSFYETFNLTCEEVEGEIFCSIQDNTWNQFQLKEILENILPMNTQLFDFEVEFNFPGIGQKTLLLNARKVYQKTHGKELILLAIEDITEKKDVEKKLLETEQLFKHAFNDSPIGMSITEMQTGRLISVNDSLCEIIGYSKEEIINLDLEKITFSEDQKKDEESIKRLLNGNIKSYEIEKRYIKKDESIVWVQLNVSLTNKISDSNVYLIAQVQDITEKKYANEQLEILNDKLQKSNQELQDFASVASHDLQEPLRKIQAFGDRLKVKFGNKLPEECREYLDRMQGAAFRMHRLINDLLSFSRVTTKAQPFEVVNLNQTVKEVIDDLEIAILDAKAKIETENLPNIDADPLQMRQLFQNLLSNALKFHSIADEPVIKIYSKYQDKNVNIYIEDNGIGFEEKYLDRIFNIFQRLHSNNEYSGTGIGLAVCKKITLRHSGSITAKSSLNKGSTFIITLPIKQIEQNEKGTNSDITS